MPKKEGVAEVPNKDGCLASGDLNKLGADTGEVKVGVYVFAGTDVMPPKREEADAAGLAPNNADEGEGLVPPKRDPAPKGF